MALEMGLWRADGDKLSRITPSAVGLESQLETYIESDPTLLGQPLLIVGRQVPTAHGGFVDLLAMDGEGVVHVLELKRDKTPRDVVAQALDYGSWVSTLSRSDIVGIFEKYRPGLAFEEAFAETFGEAPPEDLNEAQVLTIVAASVDSATERIVRFLNETFEVPVNVVFFRHFEDKGTSYLARTWLVDNETPVESKAASRTKKSKEPWNGQDWYVSFGEFPDGRQWSDAMKYGFVSAGGDKWFSRTLKNLPVGARVFACIPKVGYVGVGTVLAEARRFDGTTVEVDGVEQQLADLPLVGNYARQGDESDDVAEWAVAIEWNYVVPREQGFWKTGMFANQNSAARLRNAFTIEQVTAAFGIED
ncbi:hypothetical protein NODU109028_21190 [Nocardioides dubius]|uniref:DUF91 domain-containing protein n=1 Tax=Nocardioides dubius TaxID=317019 RepID=A0ABP4E2P4_9ACTN